MKISNSKKQLARIISENGGWRELAESAAQCIKGEISFWSDTATKRCGEDWRGSYLGACHDIKFIGDKLKNWHQTIVSRDEYFHLYPAQVEVVAVENKTACNLPVTDKPTIEQLAAEYRNRKDYAERKQKEADDAKADANAKLKALELAGEALGLLVSPISANQESELAIEVKVGDEVECIESDVYLHKYKGMVGTVLEVDDSSTPYLVDFGGDARIWCHEVKFISSP